ncbi:MAG: type I DNA topoisomerase [Deltaproteobacteria bacterium]|nr:type I DNA topoisomerase [Candidatus Anaeroferrophillacea bacterium]
MSKSLLIVESPAKARTIKKYLGARFDVKASVGHVKDLPKKELGIDFDGERFEPHYVTIRGKGKVLGELKKAAQYADVVYLAPDPDREGEAIAWHIAAELGRSNEVYRVLFHEITPQAIRTAIEHPLSIDEDKVNAQQTRRILDRLVGYKISPLLWQTVRRGLSAGRVQSVAVRLICDREAEIRAFEPQEYWSIEALLAAGEPPLFTARLHAVEGKKAEVKNAEEARIIADESAGECFTVAACEQKKRQRRPQPPFITSKLQQEAARKLGFSARKTMLIAQQLYEGVELGDAGPTGLITYMRTDSVRVADVALDDCRAYIDRRFGAEYVPAKAARYRNKNAAQDAHEAIRPTSMDLEPDGLANYLDRDQLRLYRLIWSRFVASQMTPARYYQTTVDIAAGPRYTYRAVGRRLLFDGFLALYEEGVDGAAADDKDTILPPLEEGDILKLESLDQKQHFTQPPPRFTESSLVKELEEKGIGRPSTYAAILSTIQDRGYAELRERKFYPTDLGELVTGMLVKSFADILDVSFTAQMEEKLDRVEEGKQDWQTLLRDFYGPFMQRVEEALPAMREAKRQEQETEEICEKCGARMVIKWGRNGKFLACPNYPECRNTRNLDENGQPAPTDELTAEERDKLGVCPECGSPLTVRTGRFGRFIACSRYPECRYTRSIGTGIPCPEEGCDGEIVQKTSKKGKTFYACSRYPTCNYALWDRPYPLTCPLCGHPFLVEKASRNRAGYLRCPRKGCGYKAELPERREG